MCRVVEAGTEQPRPGPPACLHALAKDATVTVVRLLRRLWCIEKGFAVEPYDT